MSDPYLVWRYGEGWPEHVVEVLPDKRETIARVRFSDGAEAWVYKHDLFLSRASLPPSAEDLTFPDAESALDAADRLLDAPVSLQASVPLVREEAIPPNSAIQALMQERRELFAKLDEAERQRDEAIGALREIGASSTAAYVTGAGVMRCEIPHAAWRIAHQYARTSARADDQQILGADDYRPLATSLPGGASTAEHEAAKSDNGPGVTSAGGESGLPHRTVAARSPVRSETPEARDPVGDEEHS